VVLCELLTKEEHGMAQGESTEHWLVADEESFEWASGRVPLVGWGALVLDCICTRVGIQGGALGK
jgi:hypothetical protein